MVHVSPVAARGLVLLGGALAGVALMRLLKLLFLKSANVPQDLLDLSPLGMRISSAAKAQLYMQQAPPQESSRAMSALPKLEKTAAPVPLDLQPFSPAVVPRLVPSAPPHKPPQAKLSSHKLNLSAVHQRPAPPSPSLEPPAPPPSALANEKAKLSSHMLNLPTALANEKTAPRASAASASPPPSSPSPPLGPYVSGGPVWPTGSASSYPWDKASRNLYKLPERRSGLKETIWADVRDKPCGTPCVAHCLVGQPRDIVGMPGLWKAYRHRLFDRFSDSPVIFVVYSASALKAGGGTGEGDTAHVRTHVQGADDKRMEAGFKYMRVDRALIMREPCSTGACLQKGAGFSCEAKPLGLKKFPWQQLRSKNVSNFCDVQVRRFQTCMHLVREYEQDHNLSFAWVARDRPDTYFAEPAARHTKIRKDTVYFKGWAACGYGGMDWFYVMPRRHADAVARFPDEMRCEYLLHPKVKPVCADCLGCECFLAAWLYSQNVPFLPTPPPWDGFIPAKFCGGGCPADWAVTPKSICRGFCEGRDRMPNVKR